MKLSIIIVSFNTKNVLDKCISSIIESNTKSHYEIIVIDNASHDGSVEMLEEKYSDVKLIKNDKNRLFAIANNQGAKIARGEYLLLLNSDTLVYDDNIDKLVRYMDEQDKNVICVGPKILNGDKTLQSQGMSDMSPNSAFFQYFKIEKLLPTFIGKRVCPRVGTYSWNCNIPHEVGWVSGCAMLIRRKEYMLLGGLNENLEFYGEEPEFSFRAKRKGFLTYYYPYAEIIHLGGYSTPKMEESKENQDISLRRYTKLVELTIGYKKAILVSRIVIISCYFKYLFVRNRKVLLNRIREDKSVIKLFKKLKNKKDTI